tara:strand:- start:905 stop:1258 length:354 start_codon:yes stop_codon:yes gene_type:complete
MAYPIPNLPSAGPGVDTSNPLVNLNKSYSFNMNITTAMLECSSFIASEIFIRNKSGQVLQVYDNGRDNLTQAFFLEDNEEITLKGLTNSDQVSAKTSSGTGLVYFRTATYSSTIPLR